MSTPTTEPLDPKQNQQVFRLQNLDRAITLRRLRAMDKIEVGLQQSLLLRAQSLGSLNGETQEYSYMFACLKVALVEPRDFAFTELDDDDLIELWKEWSEFNTSFRKPQPANVEAISG
jgi:hypothetical protein